MQRRRFSQLVAAVLVAPLWGCRPGGSDEQALVRLLGLRPEETGWLDAMSADTRRELREALEHPDDSRTPRAVDLTFSLIGNRGRTFAFVGYPAVADRRSVCDGLLRE
jgi:hypothetical protein